MKKIYILFGVCLILNVSLHAQIKVTAVPKTAKSSFKKHNYSTNGIEVVGCDTAFFPYPANWNPAVYLTNGNGFVSGTNEYGILEQANYFDLSAQNDNYITGAALNFGVATSSNPDNLSKNVIIKLYEDNNGVPGAQFGVSDSIPLYVFDSSVVGNYIVGIDFPSPVALPASKKFYVSVDLENFSLRNGDSIAVISTSAGDLPQGTGTAWLRADDSSWHNYNTVWGDGTTFLDVSLEISPFLAISENACNILPVKLISFDATRQNKKAIISWKVAEESNMKGYQLEKADNNNNYKPVTFIQAHNDYKNNFYTCTDANAFTSASTIQYRLKQIDGDGKVQYSKIVSLKSNASINNVVFANPFNGSLRVQLNLANPSKISINIYDLKGNLVGSEKPTTYGASSNSIEVKSAARLNSGMYILKVASDNEQFNYKIIKQ